MTDPSYKLTLLNKLLLKKKETLSLDDISIGNTLNNIGHIYLDQKNYDEALKYLMEALEIFRKNDKSFSSNHHSLIRTLSSIGMIYENKENLEKAAQYIDEASSIKQNMQTKLSADASPSVTRMNKLDDVTWNSNDIIEYDVSIIGQIFKKKYKVLDKLGSGAFGRVYLVNDLEENNKY